MNDVWTNKEIDEIISHYVKAFIEPKSIHESYITDEPYATEFCDKLSNNPLITKLFAKREDLLKYLNNKYSLPF